MIHRRGLLIDDRPTDGASVESRDEPPVRLRLGLGLSGAPLALLGALALNAA